MVVGPEAVGEGPVVPLFHALAGIHEIFGVGTLFPNEAGTPVLHMHAACGRDGDAVVGCTRAGLATWLIGEVILIEITQTAAIRQRDSISGFELLELP
jgi:uncharacterized protein